MLIRLPNGSHVRYDRFRSINPIAAGGGIPDRISVIWEDGNCIIECDSYEAAVLEADRLASLVADARAKSIRESAAPVGVGR